MKPTKFLLIVIIGSAIIGWGNVGPWLLNAVARPVSAIFFGLFMIFTMLEKEAALFDAEREATLRKVEDLKRRPIGTGSPAPVVVLENAA